MKTYNENGLNFEYKDYLTQAEYNALIKVSIDDLIYGVSDIEGYRYDILGADNAFFKSLCSICITDCNDELFEKVFNNGTHRDLLILIKNAQDAYDMFWNMIDKIDSIENIIDINLQNIIKLIGEKIPDGTSMEKLAKKLPKEWQKVLEEHQNIVHPIKNEDE
jgi:hypothetical protein